jgi:hypothetical protein
MAEHPIHTPHAAPGDEGFDREIDVRGIVWTAVGIVAVTAVAMALMWWLLHVFRSGAVAADRGLPAAVVEQRAAGGEAPRAEPASGPPLPAGSLLPPGPMLQPRPEDELEAMRRDDAERLGTYGWVDRERGIVHVPIERAMAEIAAEGLPRVGGGLSGPDDETTGGPAGEPGGTDEDGGLPPAGETPAGAVEGPGPGVRPSAPETAAGEGEGRR